MDERKNRSRKEEGSELDAEKERESKKRSYRVRESREKKERNRESRRRSGSEKNVEEDDDDEYREKKERDRESRRRSGREKSVEEDDDKEGREKKERDRDHRRRVDSEKNAEEDDDKEPREKKERERDSRRRSSSAKNVEEDDDKEGREKKERDREIRRRSGREKNVEEDDDNEYRERGNRRRSERERSLDADYKHKEKESRRRSEKEKSVVLDADDDKHKKRESRRRADREMSSDSDDKHKKRESRRRADRELSSDSDDKHKKRESRRRADRELSSDSDDKHKKRDSRRRSEREMSSDSDEKHNKREARRRSDRERSLDVDNKHKEKESRKRSVKERSVDVYDDDKHKQRESRHLSDREQSSDSDDKHKKRENSHRSDKESHHDRKRRRKGDDLKDRDQGSDLGSSKSVKHKEDNENSALEKKNEVQFPDNKEKNREEDLAEEQKRLDDEMEKRRRRVQEWQELKRKKEEAEQEKLGVVASSGEAKSGKNWTLEGESDDEEGDPERNTNMDVDAASNGDHKLDDVDQDSMAADSMNGAIVPTSLNEPDDEEIDPLDAYMNSMVLPEVEKLSSAVPPVLDDMVVDSPKDKTSKKGASTKAMGRIIPGEDSDSDYEDVEDEEDPIEDEDDEEFMKRVKKTKVDKLTIVDHSKIDYPAFRKNFYIEVKEIARMTLDEVSSYRKQLELKIHGKDVPKPVKTWHQTGLSTKILDTIRKLNFEKPTQIQAQALPIIMSGRDCIGIAKTGSGKTLAFVLPMLRHIKDQPSLMPGDGPVGLIMAPTRELVQQIHSDIKKFAKVVGLSCVPVYGGSGVAQQISDLKRGTEIVVCTPGRMIDILCTSSGKITNLRRVTYLVLDEADRMFDMGFEPQITRIVQNTRPDRQTVLFSATFPRQVEILARKVLDRPIEIQVGGRSVVNKDISQTVEVRPENERFLRLLEILGEWYEKGKILIFVHSQEKCDALFRDLLKHGYPCLSLHGAKDQTDRESTLADFKSNVCNLLIATSVAARGLDVKELELVLNYDVTNHYEDYVHRVGRTGRAGRKGCAITFISEEEERYAPDLVKALELSEQVVPGDLKALADGFMAKVNQGIEQAHGTGYGGSGFKFNEEEDEARKAAKKAQAKEYGFEEDKSDSEDEDDGVRKSGGLAVPTPVQGALNGALPAQVPNVSGMPISSIPAVVQATSLPGPTDAAARAQAIAAAMNLHQNLAKIQATAMPEHYEAELEINDFPQNARWKVTHKETLGPISEWTGAAITTRGQYIPPGKILGQNERKLYLFIEGPTEQSVKQAKSQLKRVLEDISMQATSLPGSAQPGRYQVL